MTEYEVRHQFWQGALEPYREQLLTARSVLLWENAIAMGLISFASHVGLCLLHNLFANNTLFSALIYLLGVGLGAYRGYQVLRMIFPHFQVFAQRESKETDAQDFAEIVDHVTLLDFTLFSSHTALVAFEERIGSFINPQPAGQPPFRVPLVPVAILLASYLLNLFSSFAVCWTLMFAILAGPRLYKSRPFIMSFVGQHWETTIYPHLQTLLQHLANLRQHIETNVLNHGTPSQQSTSTNATPTNTTPTPTPTTTPYTYPPSTPTSIPPPTNAYPPVNYDLPPVQHYPPSNEAPSPYFSRPEPSHKVSDIIVPSSSYYDKHLQPSITEDPSDSGFTREELEVLQKAFQ